MRSGSGTSDSDNACDDDTDDSDARKVSTGALGSDHLSGLRLWVPAEVGASHIIHPCPWIGSSDIRHDIDDMDHLDIGTNALGSDHLR